MGNLRKLLEAAGLGGILSPRTLRALRLDFLRLRARVGQNRRRHSNARRLHLGCGARHVVGWLNVDLRGSDWDVDLASGALPWPDESFDVIVCQHLVEHLEVVEEVLPLLRELRRVCSSQGEVWLSTPDMEKVCRYYLADQGRGLLADRQSRYPGFSLRGAPVQQMINDLFHQRGEHKNLFDFTLLSWAFGEAGFRECVLASESMLLARQVDFPPRADDYQTLYVVARP